MVSKNCGIFHPCLFGVTLGWWMVMRRIHKGLKTKARGLSWLFSSQIDAHTHVKLPPNISQQWWLVMDPQWYWITTNEVLACIGPCKQRPCTLIIFTIFYSPVLHPWRPSQKTSARRIFPLDPWESFRWLRIGPSHRASLSDLRRSLAVDVWWWGSRHIFRCSGGVVFYFFDVAGKDQLGKLSFFLCRRFPVAGRKGAAGRTCGHVSPSGWSVTV